MARADPHDLVDTSMIEAAVRSDKGTDVTVKSWEFDDFLGTGYNIASFVTSVKVSLNKDGVESKESYIIKINPKHIVEGWNSFTNDIFLHEYTYVTKLKPLIRDILPGKPEISVPTCYFVSTAREKELLIYNDLRQLGYKMYNKRVGFDLEHLTLIMKELAKLHAGSYLLMLNDPNFIDDYPIFDKDLLVMEGGVKNHGQEMIDEFFGAQITLSCKVAALYPEFKNLVPWIKDLRKNFMTEFCKVIPDYSSKFKVIGHGDLWNNNMMFKYNDNSEVTNVMLIDYQVCRVSSLVIDFHQLFYTSVSGHVRYMHLLDCLKVYHEAFKGILQEAKEPMPFTVEELHQEYLDKRIHGIIYGLSWGITTVLEDDQQLDFKDVEPEDMEKLLDDNLTNIIKLLKSSPRFEDRLFGIMNDIKHYIKDKKNQVN